jgi:leucyl/phenylalanyl-tRNA--protein transferase
MSHASDHATEITPDILLKAYAAGIFPMAEDADDPSLFWVEPRERGIIPLDGFHISKRLARTVRSDFFEVRVDRDFDGVIAGCAAPGADREKTWISRRIRDLYGELFEAGYCHTVEVYREGRLVGGLYGVRLNGAFFGESMFHTERDASKVALVHLVARLRRGGFSLLDTQFVTSHLAQFGAVEIPRRAYKQMLRDAMDHAADWHVWPRETPPSGEEVLAALQAF